MRFGTSLALVLSLALASLSLASDKLVVHEWGTFTSLQDETGRSIGGLNVNDEPLPKFVHRLKPGLIRHDVADVIDPELLSKSVQPGHADVTMRLETPVVYFYPPDNQHMIPAINVSARFNGGVLSEFYPMGESKVAEGDPKLGHITDKTIGTLAWKNVEVSPSAADAMPVSNSHVWVSPRATAATPVRVGKEAEK
jgi:hypothetical protein